MINETNLHWRKSSPSKINRGRKTLRKTEVPFQIHKSVEKYQIKMKKVVPPWYGPLTVCSCHAMYMFPSESALYSCLNVKKLLAWSRHKIWSLSDCNWSQTHNHLVCKRTLNHLANLAKWLSVPLQSNWLWVRVQLQSLKYGSLFEIWFWWKE